MYISVNIEKKMKRIGLETWMEVRREKKRNL